MVPPETVGGTAWHPCLLAEVSPHTGPTPSGNLVIDNCNLGQRNITIDYSDDSSDDTYEATGVIGNATDLSRIRRIVLHKGSIPKGANIWIRFLDEHAEKGVMANLRKPPAHKHHHGCCCSHGKPSKQQKATASIKSKDGKVYFYTSKDRLTIDVPMENGRYTPVVIGAQLQAKPKSHGHELVLIEEDLTGKQLGGFALQILPEK